MPPPLPERYRLEVRLGRDGDIEEWLGVDTSLDRPIMVKIIGPDAGPERATEFLEAVREAAPVNHPHFQGIYNAGEVPGGMYAVFEWTGGATLADRIASNESIDVADFLPSGAGLAGALAALHAEGVVHGAIDPSAIHYTVSHPAKLGGVGRHRRSGTAGDDVRALAAALELGLTGAAPGGPPPSEIIDGLNPVVDRVLREAQAGRLSAALFAEELDKAPTPVPPLPEPPSWSRRLLYVAAALVAAALGLVALGRVLTAGANGAIAVPVTSRDVAVPVPPTTTPPVADPNTPPLAQVTVTDVRTFDPFGGNEENDERLGDLVDGDPTTFWRTERYRDPLPLLKPGLGVVFATATTPRKVAFQGITTGTRYELGWDDRFPVEVEEWERVSAGRTVGGTLDIQLPERTDGWWILWITDLPPVSATDRATEIAEVRFTG